MNHEAGRQIIQISHVQENKWAYATTVALCDDGSVWQYINDDQPLLREWLALPPIPQHDLNGWTGTGAMLVAKASCGDLATGER